MIWATIQPDSPRTADWEKVFGDRRVPIESAFPQRGSAPGHPDADFYRLSLRALDPGQRERLVAHLSERFGIPPVEVEAELNADEHVPILAADVRVSIDARALL